jgi:hypothetical protein
MMLQKTVHTVVSPKLNEKEQIHRIKAKQNFVSWLFAKYSKLAQQHFWFHISSFREFEPGPLDLRHYLVSSCVVRTFVRGGGRQKEGSGTKKKRRPFYSFEVRTNYVFSSTFGILLPLTNGPNKKTTDERTKDTTYFLRIFFYFFDWRTGLWKIKEFCSRFHIVSCTQYMYVQGARGIDARF